MTSSLQSAIAQKLQKVGFDVDATVKGSVAKAVAAAVMSAGKTAPTPRPPAAPARKTEGGVPFSSLNSEQKQIIAAAEALKIAPHHFPTKEEMLKQTGPGAPNEVDQCKAAMRAQRGLGER